MSKKNKIVTQALTEKITKLDRLLTEGIDTAINLSGVIEALRDEIEISADVISKMERSEELHSMEMGARINLITSQSELISQQTRIITAHEKQYKKKDRKRVMKRIAKQIAKDQ